MSENKFSDNEIEEPEGFWPEDGVFDEEPFETIPYTPDIPEFTHPEDRAAAEPPIDKNVFDHVQADAVEPPAEQNLHVIADAEDVPREEPAVHSIPVAQEDSYAYHSSVDEEPLELDPMSELVDSRSWLDDPPPERSSFAPREFVANEPDASWQQEPVPATDPFSSDPFPTTPTEDYWVGQPAYSDPNAPVHYIPDTPDETVRRSGLAWSAGIAFFGSVAFMLFLGWLADLLLGTTPWGMVGGIVIGSVIGFIQFFRISSQIYGTSKTSDFRPLLSHSDDAQEMERPAPPGPPLS